VKIILSVLCFKLFGNVFVLKTENKSEKENDLTNKADVFAGC
jgi:5-formaminoimidazole-4-carboxamide-1-beta-D-ribofuranosyl 5'-monophosphate synthetase